MAYIYMDESWDLWFSEKTWASKYFMVTFLLVKQEKDAELLMKNVRKWAIWKKMKIYWKFFHSHKTPRPVVKRLLDLSSRRDISAMVIIAEKERIPQKYKWDVHSFYNYLAGELLDIAQKRWILAKWKKHTFIASRRETNKQLNEEFIKYMEWKQFDLYKFDYSITTPDQKKWLEVVDAISFSLEQKYEKWDLELYSVIKNKIILEKQIFD